MAAGSAAARSPHTGALGRATRLLALLGGLVMLAAAILVCVSVALRRITSHSVPGDFEYVQMAVALAAFAFFPHAQWRRVNIFVETFTSALPKRVQTGIDALWDLIYAAFAGLMAWLLLQGAVETIRNATTSMVLGLPIGWAIAAVSVMTALLAIVCVATAVALLRRAQ